VTVSIIDFISPERLNPYEILAMKEAVSVLDIYIWNQKVSLALFGDIGNVEVVMRSAIAREMVSEFGIDWFTNEDVLDSPALKSIDSALTNVKRIGRSPQELHGKLVASLTLGFWVRLLGRGDRLVTFDKVTKKQIGSDRRIFDDLLWKPALSKAFPAADPLGRATVEALARDLQFARNRVAHHEHVIWGIPAVGQKLKGGQTQRRIGLTEFHNTLLKLSALIDPELRQCIESNSMFLKVVDDCPIKNTQNLKLWS